MDQFMKSLDMMRNGCLAKFPKVPIEDLDKFRGGELPTDITKDFKCYVRCVAQLGGVLTKKGEIGIQKSLAQMQIIVPKEMHENTGGAINSCTEVREYPLKIYFVITKDLLEISEKEFKDSCDKSFAFTKCLLEYNPAGFIFP